MTGDAGGRSRYAVVAGGGTAGHVLPALAVARALAGRGHEPSSIELVGSRRGQERTLLEGCGFPVTLFPGRGIRRRLGLDDLAANVSAVGGLLWATGRSIVSMVRHRPAVVVSVGGYASVPSGVAAALCRVPIVLVNVDAVPGLAHKLLDPMAAAAAVAFDRTPLRRATVTGSPVRPEIAAVDRGPAARRAARSALGIPEEASVVVAMGGSLGARRVNTAVTGLAQRWAARSGTALFHVVGRRDFPDHQAPATTGLWYRAVPFSDDMALLYAAADLVVSRAGAMTVAELAVTGTPAVLVPLPGAPGDHQGANARAMAAAGGAVVLDDADCTAEEVAGVVGDLLADPDRLRAMGEAARALGHPDAADRVAAVVDGHAA